MTYGGSAPIHGALGLRVVRADERVEFPGYASPWPQGRPLTARTLVSHGVPRRGLTREVNAWRLGNVRNLADGARRIFAARALRLPTFYGQLFLTAHRADGRHVDLGLASCKLVTTVGVKFIADDFNNNAQDVSNLKFHGFGTGAGAEAVGNTALSTEVTNTTYVGDVRPTGSQASATVSNDATYTTVGTYSPDSGTPIAVTEHGIFSANATGTLLDKSLFSVVNLATGDSLQATYVLTLVAGG